MRSISSLIFSLAITSTLANPGRGRGGGKGWNHHNNNDLTAHSRAGSFTGFVDPDVPDVAQWLGVPYGAPPVGDQRFLPPKPAAYAGEISTTSYKPICMQNGGPGPGVFWDVVPEFQNTDPQAEDCLYLNVWVPRKTLGGSGGRRGQRRPKKVPVIIWSKSKV
jgi:carboxylesterase type B